MSQKQPGDLTDEELLEEARASRSSSIVNAFMIGFLIGVVLFGLGSLLLALLQGLSMGWGGLALLMLIPLYLIRRFATDPKVSRANAIRSEVRKRGLRCDPAR